MNNIAYLRPKSLAKASASLLSFKNAKLLAGGTDLILAIERNKFKPSHLIDLSGIRQINDLAIRDDVLHMGSMISIQAIHDSKLLREMFPVVTQAAGNLGCWQVRNRATLGGNLANAAPSAEMAPPLIALDAVVKLNGPGGGRLLPVEKFFLGPGLNALAPGEILAEVLVRKPVMGTRMFYTRHSLRRSMDISLVNTAIGFNYEGRQVKNIRVVLGAVAPIPLRAVKTEQFLEGKTLDEHLITEAAVIASGECRPITDVRATAEYRREMVKVIVRRTFLSLVGGVPGES